MKVIPLNPRGYCHGVVGAINTLKKIAADETVKRPIHVLGMVVHNQKIVDDFSELGIRTLDSRHKSRLDLLDDIEGGTIVFTAHGVSDQVYTKAREKGLDIIDTTCRDVTLSQDVIKAYIKAGYHVLFAGKHEHPESETATSISTHVTVIETETDLENLHITRKKIALTNQTTLSFYDLFSLVETAKKKFPSLEVIEEICDATKQRQNAVKMLPETTDHLFVVGDVRSNNAAQLVKVANQKGIAATLINSVEDLDIAMLETMNTVGVTAAASTPSQLTKEVIDYLETFNPEAPHTPESKVLNQNIFIKKKT